VSSGLQHTPVLHPPTALATVSERLHTPPRFDMAEGGVDEGRGARPRTTTSTIYPSDEEVSIRTTDASGTTPGGSIVTTAGGATATTTAFVTGVGDATFAPPSFRGNETEDANDWLSRFEKYAFFRDMNDNDRLRLVAVLLCNTASKWWDNRWYNEGQLGIIHDRFQDLIRRRGNLEVEEDVRSMESCPGSD